MRKLAHTLTQRNAQKASPKISGSAATITFHIDALCGNPKSYEMHLLAARCMLPSTTRNKLLLQPTDVSYKWPALSQACQHTEISAQVQLWIPPQFRQLLYLFTSIHSKYCWRVKKGPKPIASKQRACVNKVPNLYKRHC